MKLKFTKIITILLLFNVIKLDGSHELPSDIVALLLENNIKIDAESKAKPNPKKRKAESLIESSSNSKIIKCNKIKHVLKYIQNDPEDTLFIFDIDSTLTMPEKCHGLGGKWNTFMRDKAIKASLNKNQAKRFATKICGAIQAKSKHSLVEIDTFDTVKQIQKSCGVTVCLTARQKNTLNQTLKHLNGLLLDFKSSTFHPAIKDGKNYVHRDGIFCCGESKKGDALIEILSRLKYQFKRIIFLDDQLENIEYMNKELSDFSKEIEFIGLHYNYLSPILYAFDPAYADMVVSSFFPEPVGLTDIFKLELARADK